nr:UTRA domain-containing protein [Granulosicoccus sp.]
ARQGLITTRSGIGSFVTYDNVTLDSDLGWTLALAKGGVQLTTKTLTLKRGRCAASSRFLEVKNDFLCIDRVRLDNSTQKGLSYERSRLPWHTSYSHIIDEGLVEDSLNKTLIAQGITVTSGEEWAEVLCRLPTDTAKRMKRGTNEPMLKLRRVTRSADNQVVEFVDSVLDPAHFGLHLTF